MPKPLGKSRWARYLVYRAEHTRTTWTLRIAVALVTVGALWATSSWCTEAIGRSLVCEADPGPADAILIENFDPNYLLFERARQLRRAGVASRVLVPIRMDRRSEEPNDVALGIAEVMTRISRVGEIEIIPTREVEPITLNAIRDVQRYLEPPEDALRAVEAAFGRGLPGAGRAEGEPD